MSRCLSCALALAAGALILSGCKTGYVWTSRVPADRRTVAVPTFVNESKVVELGAAMARQVAREFQREGTFKLRRTDQAALEIQGVVKSASSSNAGYSRTGGLRVSSYAFRATVVVSVVDKRSGKVLVDNREYTAETTYTSGNETTTSQRDASGRLADDLARQVVDDVLNLKW